MCTACAEGFEAGGGVVGVHSQLDLDSYWLTDLNYLMRDQSVPTPTTPPTPRPVLSPEQYLNYSLYVIFFIQICTVFPESRCGKHLKN